MSIPDDGFRRAQQMYDNTDDFLHQEPETAEDRKWREVREQDKIDEEWRRNFT
jgi:hypothetical protein